MKEYCAASILTKTYHQLLVNDHLADDAVNHGDLQLKHLRKCLHAGGQKQKL